ncbi:non-hydrolyzing UDP-N-acetylglucosamine 2-epimerase [Marinitoga litoralis]|uniref:non-hydrolyzing UDP-N-acetylglucosamine 2-epimerase n=1 Tax=Marinitoga litoralis TaxID=570855 RepID=UPI001EF837F0|nr:UDP-N-acetylglucosamine 2-epimerase (non-hydrolyzing) [Marinitoga litoralis]MBM7558291.1 UDP-N-acetylglucosamine 2-epimerase (non-hydrolyzing) [Marinitoga litoralis]
MKVGLIFGTRPEAIKMAPVYHTLREYGIDAKIIATAQHREMLDQVLELFDIKPDYDLNVMTHRQTLPELTKNLIEKLDKVLKEENFDYILVQGDTTSTFVGALISFYYKIPVGHIEAGLRTDNIYNPFPEEMNRRLTSVISSLHFPPTNVSKYNLLKEGISEDKIFITGNTVIDALLWVIEKNKDKIEEILSKYDLLNKKYILMTMHRRENWGEPMKNVMQAVKEFLLKNKDIYLVFPVHLNPAVRDIVFPELENLENAILINPVEYLEFTALMSGSYFIMTDSGGIQEEAPALGKPTLVLRETTERPEAIGAGTAKLIGTNKEVVLEYMNKLAFDKEFYSKMSNAKNPFGDGKASMRIAKILLNEDVEEFK